MERKCSVGSGPSEDARNSLRPSTPAHGIHVNHYSEDLLQKMAAPPHVCPSVVSTSPHTHLLQAVPFVFFFIPLSTFLYSLFVPL